MKRFLLILSLLFPICLFAQTNKPADSIALKPDLRKKIISESKDGGKLDYWTPIKGHEYDGHMIEKGTTAKDNIYASNREIAVIKWALSLSKIGLKKTDIISLYEELKDRKIISDEIKLLDIGIKKAVE